MFLAILLYEQYIHYCLSAISWHNDTVIMWTELLEIREHGI